MNYTVADLFCGAGGFCEGFKKTQQYQTIFATDVDYDAIQTFSFNHRDIPSICKDISELSEEDICDLMGSRNLDVLVGGPPCQGFSIAGQRIIDDPKNQLFLEYARVVNTLQPKIIIFENVLGLISLAKGEILSRIQDEFLSMGYKSEIKVLNSADFGVPQARPRVFIIGRKDDKKIYFPNPTHEASVKEETQRYLFNDNLLPHVTVKDAFSNLPIIQQGMGSEEVEFTCNPENEFQEQVRGNRTNSILFNHRATKHNQKVVERYLAMKPGTDGSHLPDELRTKKNNYFKLNPNLPSRTVTCNFRTDLIHPYQPRGLTTREAARLQSFDDDYKFFGNLTRKAKFLTQDDQVGNAVPPLLAKAIAEQILEDL